MNLKTSQKGFTIVELLIVIVVIAILAAISIVAFTGIQQRGRDSARQADVANIVKALSACTADGVAWPITGAAAVTALNSGGTCANLANLGASTVNKLGTTPTSSANTTFGYTVCPASATAGNGTGAQITWWKEQGGAGLQTVTAGSC